jgi:predicted nucleic acid-binding protein
VKSALFDTNILIDATQGLHEARTEFAYWERPAISAITFIEMHCGVPLQMKPEITNFIPEIGFEIIHIDSVIIDIAARIRSDSIGKRAKIALPDAIILATAQACGLTIVTRNKKDFKGPNVRIPYELETIISTRVINVRPIAS